jgi:hypothetical protein
VQGGNLTRAGKAREWWLATVGLRWGGQEPRESGVQWKRWAGRSGDTLKRSPSLREVSRSRQTERALRLKTTRWMNHEVGAPNL